MGIKQLNNFIKEAIYLTAEENAVIEHQIPMTQDLFEQCLSDLVRVDSASGFSRLCRDFPKQFKTYMRKEEDYLATLAQRDIPEELTDQLWQRICSDIYNKQ